MGHRVSHYKTGITVDANETSSIYRGLISIAELGDIKNNFAVYRSDFNEAAVQNKLSTFINSILKN